MPFLSRLENEEASGYGVIVVKWGGVGFTVLRAEEMSSILLSQGKERHGHNMMVLMRE